MNETMKDAMKLADQIKAKHGDQIVQIAHTLNTLGMLCPFMGHPMHEFMNECVLAYCEKTDVDVDAVNACIEDIKAAETTIAELAQLEAGDMRSTQGHGVGADFFSRFKKSQG